MASTKFGIVLQERLREAGKTQQEIAEQMGVSEATISNFNATERLRNADTMYKSMVALFPVLISEHVLTSTDQVIELVNLIPFKPFKNKSEERVAEQSRKEIKELALAKLKEQQELDKPKYYTREKIELIGRNKDIEEILTKLQDEHMNFLTLVGLPGVGKTELARIVGTLAVAKKYFAAMLFMPLDQLIRTDDVIDQLKTIFSGKDLQEQILIILDSCERIEGLKEKLLDFLQQHPMVKILATSTAELSIKHHLVLPLEVPHSEKENLEELLKNSAIRFFLVYTNINREILKLTHETTRHVATICKGLGGLPQALIIAAARVGEFGVDGLVERLKKNSILTMEYQTDIDRHKTLNALIEWNYKLLQEDEQELLRLLSVIPRYFSLEEARAICAIGGIEGDLENIIHRLANRRLLTYIEEETIDMHNTIRSFARRQLDEEEESDYARFLFMEHGSYFMHSYYLRNVYNREIIEELAEKLGFLEKGLEDYKTTEEALRDVLNSYYSYMMVNDIVFDCFKRYSTLFPYLLKRSLDLYRATRKKLSGNIDGKIERKNFFDAFESVYRPLLLEMIREDAVELINFIKTSDDNKLWFFWDFYAEFRETSRFDGLTEAFSFDKPEGYRVFSS